MLLGSLPLLVVRAAHAAVVPATVVVAEGDTPPGASAPINSINPPFVEGGGVVAFTGALVGSESYVFRGDEVIWRNGLDLMVTLSGTEGTMGTAPDGSFIYSPSVDGNDAVYTHNGPLAVDGQQAPGLPVGVNVTFNSRPSMNDTGAAYWVAGINAAGGTTTLERVLYRSATGSFADSEVVLQGGDIVDGLVIDPVGIGFGYQTSHDDQHLIIGLTIAGQPTTSDSFVDVDGIAVAVEGEATGGGDLWANFDLLAINNSGDYLISGDTNGVTTSDEFIAHNGQILVREGDVVGGITLTSSASVNMASINDVGSAAFVWNVSGGTETAFFACDAASMAVDAQALLSTGDELDLDGDGTGDGLFVEDFSASTGALSRALANDGSIHLELDLTDGVTQFEAVVRLQGDCGMSCGDGTTDPGEECDDANMIDTDACIACTAATCGDGFVWDEMEECDDGNDDDTDGCTNLCTVDGAGSSSGGGESSGGTESTGGEDPSTGGETTGGGDSSTGGGATTGGEDASTGGGLDTTGGGLDTTGGGLDTTGGGLDTTGGGLDTTGGGGGTLPGDTAPGDASQGEPSTSGDTDTDTDGSGQVTGDGCGCTTERGSGRGLIGTLGLLLLMLPGIGRRRLRS